MTKPRSAGNTTRLLTNPLIRSIMAKTDLTAERLREVLHYNPETGVFTRLKTEKNWRSGDIAGGFRAGYIQIRVDGAKYSAHRLAWLYAYGVNPIDEIDHIDGNKSNNALSNLRQATHAENQQNKPIQKNNSSGFVGICWHKGSGKWHAKIQHMGRSMFLGQFDKKEDAYRRYLGAKAEIHKFGPEPRKSA
jgi:hypothetical protein